MRENVRAFVRIAAETFWLQGPVYEFGAYRVAGQEQLADLRAFFPGAEYVGCDMRPGPGVDRVEDLHRLTLPDESAGAILCVDTLEHVFDVHRAVAEMIRTLRPGGTLLISVPMRFRIHAYPDDYWRLTPSCLARLLAPLDAALVGSQGTESFPHTVFALASKAPAPAFASEANRFLIAFQRWLKQAEAERPKSWSQRLKLLLRGKGQRRDWRQRNEARFAIGVPATESFRGEPDFTATLTR